MITKTNAATALARCTNRCEFEIPIPVEGRDESSTRQVFAASNAIVKCSKVLPFRQLCGQEMEQIRGKRWRRVDRHGSGNYPVMDDMSCC